MKTTARAFTRTELTATIAAISLLCVFAAPLFGTARGNSQRASCLNNLRQIGHAAQRWAGDHGDRVPWWTPIEEGGTMRGAKPGNAWAEWTALSNELKNAAILACPSDDLVRVAGAFNGAPGGFLNSDFRANANSYVVALHALTEFANTMLATDRNLRFYPRTSCSTGINNAETLYSPFSTAAWTNAVHGALGNVVLIDGRVETTSSTRLRELIAAEVYSGTHHFLRAR